MNSYNSHILALFFLLTTGSMHAQSSINTDSLLNAKIIEIENHLLSNHLDSARLIASSINENEPYLGIL